MSQNKKINIGVLDWRRDGWDAIDHNEIRPFSLPRQIWRLPYPDEAYEVVFCSHVIEHVSHFQIEQTICEINRILAKDGVLRLLTPDLKKLAKAYVENDFKMMDIFIEEDGGEMKRDLGLGQAFLNFILSAGYDNFLVSSDYSRILAGYAHISCYDYEMLHGLLGHYGFYDIRRCDIDDSAIEDHTELRRHRYDSDKNHSLIIECRKERYIPFVYGKALLHTGPYDVRRIVPSRYNPVSIILVAYAYSRNLLLYCWRRVPADVQRRAKAIFRKGHDHKREKHGEGLP